MIYATYIHIIVLQSIIVQYSTLYLIFLSLPQKNHTQNQSFLSADIRMQSMRIPLFGSSHVKSFLINDVMSHQDVFPVFVSWILYYAVNFLTLGHYCFQDNFSFMGPHDMRRKLWVLTSHRDTHSQTLGIFNFQNSNSSFTIRNC